MLIRIVLALCNYMFTCEKLAVCDVTKFTIYGYKLEIHFHIWLFCDVTSRILLLQVHVNLYTMLITCFRRRCKECREVKEKRRREERWQETVWDRHDDYYYLTFNLISVQDYLLRTGIRNKLPFKAGGEMFKIMRGAKWTPKCRQRFKCLIF